MQAVSAARAPGRPGITLILAGLAMLGPFSINAYLPSFPEMERALHTDRVALQQTISVYFAAFAFMSLWHGAISDSWGRRKVVLAGLATYALASLAACSPRASGSCCPCGRCRACPPAPAS